MTDSSSAGQQEILLEEIDALKAIYVSEIEVENFDSSDKDTTVAVHLYPATADRAEEQYVKLTLVLRIPQVYPTEIPAITVRNPRGLSDEDLLRITSTLKDAAESKKGCPMLYELIELVKDFLTAGNRPYGDCCICLSGFHPDDVYTKTSCFHHFHSHCLARYVTSQEDVRQDEDKDTKQAVTCPVCRETITCDLASLAKAESPVDSRRESESNILEELKEVQAKMKSLFEKQKSQGGIIDVEAEKNKYLLEISSIPNVPTRNAESTSANKKPSGGRRPSRQDRNSQNLSAKKPTEAIGEVQTEDAKQPESGKPNSAPRQQRHVDSQGPPRKSAAGHEHDDSNNERWKPSQGGYPEWGQHQRFDDRRPRGAPPTRRWRQGPPPTFGRGHHHPPSNNSEQPGQRQPPNRSRIRQGGFSGRNFFRSPNVQPVVKTDAVTVTKANAEEVVGVSTPEVDAVRHPAQVSTQEAQCSTTVGFAQRSKCNMWTVSGPPPGFRMKPAFPSRSAFTSATPNAGTR